MSKGSGCGWARITNDNAFTPIRASDKELDRAATTDERLVMALLNDMSLGKSKLVMIVGGAWSWRFMKVKSRHTEPTELNWNYCAF